MRYGLLACAAALVLCLAGCGGDSASGDGRTVAASQWAERVCTTLTPWRGELGALTTRAQQQMDVAGGAEQAKSGLVSLLDGARTATEQARVRVADLGVPKATNGAQVASAFVDSLRRTRDAYATARDTVAALPTQNAPAFYDRVAAAFRQLDRDYKASAVDPASVNSAELRQAFDAAPACR
jgi:hypothetical protein